MDHTRIRGGVMGSRLLRSRLLSLRVLLALAMAASTQATSLWDLDLEADDLQSGLPVPISSFYRGKVLVVVNVASQCGYTDSAYAGLNDLHERYASSGMAILAFPCNQFGAQEPGSHEEIFSFATKTKHVAFDMFRKVDVNGPDAHPLFRFLRGEAASGCTDVEGSCEAWAEAGECTLNPEFMHASCRRSCKLCSAADSPSEPIKWNFETFLVSRQGTVQERWRTGTDLQAPENRRTIEALLAAKDEI